MRQSVSQSKVDWNKQRSSSKAEVRWGDVDIRTWEVLACVAPLGHQVHFC